MKRAISLFLFLSLLSAGLTGCGNAAGATISGMNHRFIESVQAQTNKNEMENEEAEPMINESEGDSSILIVYYSYSGTTRRAAERLQALTGGNLYELTLTDPYTGDSYDVSDRVFAERDAEEMPELSGELPDISEYDTILIGTPVWNDSMANPVFRYLQRTDLSGKKAALFWTYITNEGTTEKDFSQQAQKAQVCRGLALRSANAISDNKMDQMFQNWLKQIREAE